MPRAPRVSGRDLVAALKKAGFEVTTIRGIHHIMRIGGKRPTSIPVHGRRILPPKTLTSILAQAGITVDELAELLK